MRDERGAETLWVRGKCEADTSWIRWGRWEIIKKVRNKILYLIKKCV